MFPGSRGEVNSQSACQPVPQPLIVAQFLRLHPTGDPPGISHQVVELLVGSHVQLAEQGEEPSQVLHLRHRATTTPRPPSADQTMRVEGSGTLPLLTVRLSISNTS